MKDVRILIVDDHPVVREGYRRLIELQSGFRIVAEAGDAREAYAKFREARPDVVVMDVSLPGASGVEALRHIRQYDPAARIVVFTMHQGAAFALKAIEAGACGYVTKSSDPEALIRALLAALSGRKLISDDVVAAIASDRLFGASERLRDLTPRQTEILRLLAHGWTDGEIADALVVSRKTVQNNHYHLKSLLGLKTDVQLAWFALEAGLTGDQGAACDGVPESVDRRSPLTLFRSRS